MTRNEIIAELNEEMSYLKEDVELLYRRNASLDADVAQYIGWTVERLLKLKKQVEDLVA